MISFSRSKLYRILQDSQNYSFKLRIHTIS